jgi:hypothetical protein
MGVNMNYYLYIDDIREDLSFSDNLPLVNGHHWDLIILRSYRQVIDFFVSLCYHCEDNIFLDLDHDLGDLDIDNDGEMNLNAPTGYDICKYIVEHQIPLVGFHIHSMNPVGVQNMRQLLTHYGYKEY